DDPAADCRPGARASVPGPRLSLVFRAGSTGDPTSLGALSELSRRAALFTVRPRRLSRARPVRAGIDSRGDGGPPGGDRTPVRPQAGPAVSHLVPHGLSPLRGPISGPLGGESGPDLPPAVPPAGRHHANAQRREQGRPGGSGAAAHRGL